MIGPEKPTLSTNQMQDLIKTNHELVARVFPRLKQFGSFYFEFLLALEGIFPRLRQFGSFYFEFLLALEGIFLPSDGSLCDYFGLI